MKDDPRNMTCEEFTARMAQLVASGEDIFAHPHVKNCKVHRALLEDLEAIARAARQLFPGVDPSDRLWERIKDKIAPKRESGKLVSDPFPGFRLMVRTRVMDKHDLQHNAMDGHRDVGGIDSPIHGTRVRFGGTPRSCPGEEGRR